MQQGVLGVYQCGPLHFQGKGIHPHIYKGLLESGQDYPPSYILIKSQSIAIRGATVWDKVVFHQMGLLVEYISTQTVRSNTHEGVEEDCVESCWVIRGTQFHFAVIWTDCRSRWRTGVAGEILPFLGGWEVRGETVRSSSLGEQESAKQTVSQSFSQTFVFKIMLFSFNKNRNLKLYI